MSEHVPFGPIRAAPAPSARALTASLLAFCSQKDQVACSASLQAVSRGPHGRHPQLHGREAHSECGGTDCKRNRIRQGKVTITRLGSRCKREVSATTKVVTVWPRSPVPKRSSRIRRQRLKGSSCRAPLEVKEEVEEVEGFRAEVGDQRRREGYLLQRNDQHVGHNTLLPAGRGSCCLPASDQQTRVLASESERVGQRGIDSRPGERSPQRNPGRTRDRGRPG